MGDIEIFYNLNMNADVDGEVIYILRETSRLDQ
jgi:hypothetical protein